MSKRNSQEAKRAARERLRIEREKQAKKEKMRRQLAIGGGIVAVLALAGGIGIAVANLTGGGEGDASNWEAATKVASQGAGGSADGVSYKAPANASGKMGTDIVIGEKNAEHTLTVYEDMRCPVCASFEQNTGEVLMKDLEEGKYKASFVFGTFLDERPGLSGTGSKNALSALGAALNVSPEAFLEYKKTLFSKENHPPENEDEFADDQHLVDIGQQVDALAGNKKFEKAVLNGTFDAWAMKISKKFDSAEGVKGTPAFKMDGKVLSPEGAPPGTPLITPQQFKAAVDKALA